jgi:sugar lactone lactonase YvrE
VHSEPQGVSLLKRIASLAALAAVVLTLPLVAVGASFPDRIELPNGWLPEGIATGDGTSFYAGSRAAGAVWKGDLRTGEGSVLVQPRTGRVATGLMVDRRDRLFVSGANTGQAWVYDADDGTELAAFTLATTPTFINDVVVTREAAWFTDSMKPVLYRIPIGRRGALGAPETVALSGDYVHQMGFNLNGIDATRDGRTLIVVQSNTGKLFTVDRRGVTEEIDLGGATVTNGDGILLDGRRTLYVVRNQLNQIAEVRLSRDLESGRVVDTITDPGFDIPTTIDEFGNSLYAVNARFNTPPTPQTPYWVTRVDK